MKQELESVEEILAVNGVDGATGAYLMPGLTAAELARVARRETLDERLLAELRLRQELVRGHFGPDLDSAELAETGWGVVFAGAEAGAEAVREALGELFAHRREQAGELYREYRGEAGLQPEESKTRFLARHGVGPGPPVPWKVPYHLLLVGSPEAIPYSFQVQLDVQYAVGRLHFDRLEDYASYARSVVAGERGGLARRRAVTCFGPETPGDRATLLSASQLVRPLAQCLADTEPGWEVRSLLAGQATRANLDGVLAAPDGPALLFTASHGMGWPNGDPRQSARQGALLCQDWPGPAAAEPIREEHCFGAADVSADARVAGLVAFFFACYGAGTPRFDDFAHQAFGERLEIAPRPFVAALPQRLLSHPRGSAQAVVGHVDRAWGCSFSWPGAGSQTAVYEVALRALLAGRTVGAAMDAFNRRYAELATVLAGLLEDEKFGKAADPRELATQWTAHNDARNFVVLGDPAVRLAVGRERRR